MGVTEKFCLKWNDFESNISHSFRELREDKDFFDLTLACDDENQISAHKVILAACSPFFRSILRRNKHEHPLLYLKGIKHTDLTAVLNFMYHGEVNVAQEDLNSFLAVAEELKVKGLTQQKKSEEKKENSSLSHPVTTPKSSTKSKLSRDSSSISGGEDSNSASFSQPPTKKARAQPSLSQHTSYPSTSNDSDEIQEIIPVKSEPSSSRAMPPTIPITDSTEDDSNLVMQGGGGYPETAQNYPGDYEDYGEGGYEDEGAFEEPMMDNMNSSVSVDPSKDLEDYARKVWTDQGKMLQCLICNKIVKHKKNLREHIEGQHQHNEYFCTQCGKVLNTKGALRMHMKRNHPQISVNLKMT